VRRKETHHIVVLAGPNGAGKSTTGPTLLRDTLGITEFVDADIIARGISAFDPENVALQAGKVMLRRIRELVRRRADFAFETTLAIHSLAPWLVNLRKEGYCVHIIFLWLPSADFAVDRVRDRVRMGGHSVPEQTIRRRYYAGLRNLFKLYLPIAETWRIYDNSRAGGPRLIAMGKGTCTEQILDEFIWKQILEETAYEK